KPTPITKTRVPRMAPKILLSSNEFITSVSPYRYSRPSVGSATQNDGLSIGKPGGKAFRSRAKAPDSTVQPARGPYNGSPGPRNRHRLGATIPQVPSCLSF